MSEIDHKEVAEERAASLTEEQNHEEGQLRPAQKLKDALFCAVLVLLTVLLFGLMCYWAVIDEKQNTPTKEISEKQYSSYLEYLEKIDTDELESAKSLFKEAIEKESNLEVKGCFLRIWADDGLTTLEFYWNDGEKFYRTKVVDENYSYAYYAAGIIEGAFYKETLKSARYDGDYIVVYTSPHQHYDFFYAT